jgi:hypothetical protein
MHEKNRGYAENSLKLFLVSLFLIDILSSPMMKCQQKQNCLIKDNLFKSCKDQAENAPN